MMIKKIKLFLFTIVAAPFLLAYHFCREKLKVNKDIEVWAKYYEIDSRNKLLALCVLIVEFKEFRNVFYMRLGRNMGLFLRCILPASDFLSLRCQSATVGGGFFVQHGNSTIVTTKSIGENFWVNQNVTVGSARRGYPSIGNNVRIGTGAIVLGPIIIGDNVKIGAGAIVLKNIPANCTVVSPHAYIIKKDGLRVKMEL